MSQQNTLPSRLDIAAADQTFRYLPSRSRAAVALILRRSANHELQCLFILRAQNERDRWSGQVAFPGGRMQRNDRGSELRAVVREVREEIGLSLDRPEQFQVLFRLDDRFVFPYRLQDSPMVICPFVFLQVCADTPALTLEPKEVSAVRWVSLSYLASLPESAIEVVGSPFVDRFPFRFGKIARFPGVRLPPTNTIPSVENTKFGDDQGPSDPRFLLWGLTYAFTLNLLRRLGYYSLPELCQHTQYTATYKLFDILAHSRLSLLLAAQTSPLARKIKVMAKL